MLSLHTENLSDTARQVGMAIVDMKISGDRARNSLAWQIAEKYVISYPILSQLYLQEFGKPASATNIYEVIRKNTSGSMPCSSSLSNARGIQRAFPDLFQPGHIRVLPYYHYHYIANCGLKVYGAKRKLRMWAEKNRPTQSELRAEIARLVAEEQDRPWINLQPQTGTIWDLESGKRRRRKESGQEDGQEDEQQAAARLERDRRDVLANLLYHFSSLGGLVLDLTGHNEIGSVLTAYALFQTGSRERCGPRRVETNITGPAQLCIAEVHAPDDDLPWADIQSALAPNGVLALIADDFCYQDAQPLAFPLLARAQAAGFRLLTPIYVPQSRQIAPVPLPDPSSDLFFQRLTLIWILALNDNE